MVKIILLAVKLCFSTAVDSDHRENTVFIHRTCLPSPSTVLLLELPPAMTPPWCNIHSGRQSGSSSKLPVSRPLSQPSHSLPDQFEQGRMVATPSRYFVHSGFCCGMV